MPSGWLGSWAGREALAVAHRQEQRLAVRREGDCGAELAALAARQSRQITWRLFQAARGVGVVVDTSLALASARLDRR